MLKKNLINLISKLKNNIYQIRKNNNNNNNKLKVYFEEWNDPYITAIKWVSELIRALNIGKIFLIK